MGWRSIMGLVAGVVLGSLIIMGLEMAGHALFHISESAPADSVPVSMQLAVVAFYVIASFVGGAVAARIGRTSFPSFGVGGVLLGMGLWSGTITHQPAWMIIATSVALFVPAIMAGRLFARPLPPAAPPAQHELPLSH